MKKEDKVVINNKIIPEFISGSSTLVVYQQQASKTLKKFQGLSNFITARGFTLIELLVVVLIIGILAAVAVPQYQIAVAKSRYANLKILVKSIADAQEVYYLANGQYATTFEELDIDIGGTADPNNKARRTFDWGYCAVSSYNILCRSSLIESYPQKYYTHLSNHIHEGYWVCVAKSVDLDGIQNKICKQETGLSTPTKDNTTYLEWHYAK